MRKLRTCLAGELLGQEMEHACLKSAFSMANRLFGGGGEVLENKKGGGKPPDLCFASLV